LLSHEPINEHTIWGAVEQPVGQRCLRSLETVVEAVLAAGTDCNSPAPFRLVDGRAHCVPARKRGVEQSFVVDGRVRLTWSRRRGEIVEHLCECGGSSCAGAWCSSCCGLQPRNLGAELAILVRRLRNEGSKLSSRSADWDVAGALVQYCDNRSS